MSGRQSYELRGFCDGKEVITSTVAIVPGGSSYPFVGQVVDERWEITEILQAPAGEYWIRVKELARSR